MMDESSDESRGFRQRLRERKTKSPFEASEDLWRYREAASVLTSFDSELLRPIGSVSPSSNARTELLADCDVVSSRTEGMGGMGWTLRTPVRQAALRRLIKVTPINTATLRRRLADETVARGGYVFA